MIVTGYNATIYTFEGVQYILYSAYQGLYQENVRLKKTIGEKDILLTQMGGQLQEAVSERWHMRLDKVSLKKCPTPQKKLLAALKEHGSNDPVRIDTLALAAGMPKRTAQRHLEEMESKRYLTKRYDRNDLYIRLNPEIERTPFTIEKMTPVERNPNWGGLREKKDQDGEGMCENCGSPHIRGHKHLSYECDDCGHFGDEWKEIPDMPTVLLPAVQIPARRELVQVSLPVTPVPVTFAPAPAPGNLGKHPRGIGCPDCQAREHWRPVPTDWGGTIYVCALCTPEG